MLNTQYLLLDIKHSSNLLKSPYNFIEIHYYRWEVNYITDEDIDSWGD